MIQIITAVIRCITTLCLFAYALHWAKVNLIDRSENANIEMAKNIQIGYDQIGKDLDGVNWRLDKIENKQDETLNILKNIVKFKDNIEPK